MEKQILAGCGILNDSMNKKALAIILLLVVIAGTLAWTYYANREPTIDLDIYQTLGAITAEETAKLLGNKGEIVVITWDSSESVTDTQIASFERAIKKHQGIWITATEKIPRDSAVMMAMGGAAPIDQFLKIVQAHPRVGAVVLFLAFPNLPPAQLKTLNESHTKFVVVSGCNPGYKQLLINRVIDLAIVPRFHRTTDNRPAQTMQESFDQTYQVVTPEQAVNLPY
jgi:hypothetical protein